MPSIEENAFQIARYMLENPEKDGQIEMRDSLKLSDSDFRIALKFLVDGNYCGTYGQFGSKDAGIRQKNLAKLQDFVNQVNRNRIVLSLDEERLMKFLFESSTPMSDSDQTMNTLGWEEKRYLNALEKLKLKKYIDIQYADDKPFDVWLTSHGREVFQNDFHLTNTSQSSDQAIDSSPLNLDDFVKVRNVINNYYFTGNTITGSAIGSHSKRTQKKQQESKVFISYSRDDLVIAEEIYQFLLSNNYNVWMDKHNLIPGQDWEAEIRKNIKSSDFFIACLSPRSVTKRGYVQKELKLGLLVLDQIPEDKIFFIPIRIEDCEMPESLSSRQWLDWSNADAKEKLLMALELNKKQ